MNTKPRKIRKKAEAPFVPAFQLPLMKSGIYVPRVGDQLYACVAWKDEQNRTFTAKLIIKLIKLCSDGVTWVFKYVKAVAGDALPKEVEYNLTRSVDTTQLKRNVNPVGACVHVLRAKYDDYKIQNPHSGMASF